MTTRLLLLGLLVSAPALAQVSTIGDVIVVPDPSGSIHQRVTGFSLPGLTTPQALACQDASRAALGALGDEFDFLVMFLSEPVTGPYNTPAYGQARMTAQNIGTSPLMNDGTPFGSRAKLKGCISMGSAQRLPADPDAVVGDVGSGQLGMLGVEVVGHEVGHAWLVGADFDEGFGKREDLRGGDRHYQPRVDSRSVMFGGCIDALGGGDFRVRSCPRGYNSMDQYFMGLVPASAVRPLLLVEGQGSNDPLMPLAPGAAPVTIMGTGHQVSIDAVIRQMGPRQPAFPNTQRCFRTGFVVVTRSTPSSGLVLQVDAYRRRFESWFTTATDGHGFIDTRAVGTGCVVPSSMVDAGTPEADAGVMMPEEDAGLPAEPTPDAGSGGPDVSQTMPGAPPERIGTRQLGPLGCGCSSTDGAWALLALSALINRARPRR